jgi:hypothetical protein
MQDRAGDEGGVTSAEGRNMKRGLARSREEVQHLFASLLEIARVTEWRARSFKQNVQWTEQIVDNAVTSRNLYANRARAGGPFAGGEVLRAAHTSGQAHKGLRPFTGLALLQLIAYELALEHAAFGYGRFQPRRQRLSQTDSNCMTHMTKVHSETLPSASPTVGAAVIMSLALSQAAFAAAAQQKTFTSAEEAVKAAIAAARKNDDTELLAIFGAKAKELISSGDAIADKQRRERFLKAFDEKNRLVKEGENTVIVIGNNDWPFPIPLVKKGNNWLFDTEAGREEILNRRIGENELNTIQVLLAVVDAQREYAMKDRDGNGLLEYAQKFISDAGKKNGLYWEMKQGEDPIPIGPLVAEAMREGYKAPQPGGKPTPYYGYYYKLLTAQGKNAPGGAYEYLVKGKLIGGFAVVAYPATYENSGVVTFIVNHDGVVYEKDLGKNTEKTAQAMKLFDPDKAWKKAQEATAAKK